MGKQKKRAKKKAQSGKKKKTSGAGRVKRAAEPALSVEQKQRLHKPGPDLDEMIEAFVPAWRETQRKLKVPDISPARLESAGRRAEKAQARYDTKKAEADRKLAPLADAALVAKHEAFDMLLAANKVMQAIAEKHPDVARAFEPFSALFAERFSGGGGRKTEGES